jgi:hypothetical protein
MTRVYAKEGPVAQRLELTAHNRLVGGSSPSGPTTLCFGNQVLGRQLAIVRFDLVGANDGFVGRHGLC